VTEATARQIFPELKLKPEGVEAIGGDQHYVTHLDHGRRGPKSDPWPWIFLIVLVILLAVSGLGAGLLIWYPPKPQPTTTTPTTTNPVTPFPTIPDYDIGLTVIPGN